MSNVIFEGSNYPTFQNIVCDTHEEALNFPKNLLTISIIATFLAIFCLLRENSQMLIFFYSLPKSCASSVKNPRNSTTISAFFS
jgi:hypothetical protein